MVNWSEIASAAYHAYAQSTGNKNFRGEPMPGWDDLPAAIKTAWIAAVKEATRQATIPILSGDVHVRRPG